MRKINLKCNVIICGPAIGKTYLAEKDTRFVDLDEIKANYKYGLDNLTREEKENGKLNRGQIINKDSTNYAINIMEKEIKKGNIILLSYSSKKVIEYIINKQIKYCLVYASKDSYSEYALRMKKRGNSSNFIEKMTNKDVWEEFYYSNENDANSTYKIELKKGQYLSDIKDIFLMISKQTS